MNPRPALIGDAKVIRDQCKVLIGRQIALIEGYGWKEKPDTLQQMKIQTRLLTAAENILATVERKAAKVFWT